MKKIPKTWLPPTAAEREYAKDLKGYAKLVTDNIRNALFLHQDDDEEWRAAVLRALMDLPQKMQPQTERIGLTARVYADKVAAFNEAQFHNVVKSVTGMDFFKPEPWLQRVLENWAAENALLIKSIPDRQIAKVQNLITQAAINGTGMKDLREQLEKVENLPMERAELIADDQIGKLNGQLTRIRQESIGIKQYRWRGRLDNRERDSHLVREGKVYSWNKPPIGGHPGSEIRCRCHAQPIFPELAELDAQFFTDGGNRHYNEQMLKRGLNPINGGAAVYAAPYAQYGYFPRGGKISDTAQKVKSGKKEGKK